MQTGYIQSAFHIGHHAFQSGVPRGNLQAGCGIAVLGQTQLEMIILVAQEAFEYAFIDQCHGLIQVSAGAVILADHFRIVRIVGNADVIGKNLLPSLILKVAAVLIQRMGVHGIAEIGYKFRHTARSQDHFIFTGFHVDHGIFGIGNLRHQTVIEGLEIKVSEVVATKGFQHRDLTTAVYCLYLQIDRRVSAALIQTIAIYDPGTAVVADESAIQLKIVLSGVFRQLGEDPGLVLQIDGFDVVYHLSGRSQAQIVFQIHKIRILRQRIDDLHGLHQGAVHLGYIRMVYLKGTGLFALVDGGIQFLHFLGDIVIRLALIKAQKVGLPQGQVQRVLQLWMLVQRGLQVFETLIHISS